MRTPSQAAFDAIAACAAAHFSADGLCAECVDGLLKNAREADEATAKIFLTAQALRDGLAHAEQRVAGVREQCAVIAESFDPWDEHYPCCKDAAAKAIRETI